MCKWQFSFIFKMQSFTHRTLTFPVSLEDANLVHKPTHGPWFSIKKASLPPGRWPLDLWYSHLSAKDSLTLCGLLGLCCQVWFSLPPLWSTRNIFAGLNQDYFGSLESKLKDLASWSRSGVPSRSKLTFPASVHWPVRPSGGGRFPPADGNVNRLVTRAGGRGGFMPLSP